MTYLIDGHNLIPKAGLSLRDAEDEQRLIRLLQEFARIHRKRVEVYFDGAPPGENRVRKYGTITAHFVRKGRTADDAILARLRREGRAARNFIVVSSDRQVRANARAYRAESLTSEAFAALLRQKTESDSPSEKLAPEDIPPDEVERWLKIFGGE